MNQGEEKDTRFMIYHMVAFMFYTINIIVYDVMALSHPNLSIPEADSLGFRIYNLTVPVTNMISQICLFWIIKKNAESLRKVIIGINIL